MRYLVNELKNTTAEVGNEVSARPDMFVNATVSALDAACDSICNTPFELRRVHSRE